MAISKRIDDNTMMRMHESFLKNHKKAVILTTSGAIVVVLVAVYAWMSYQTWQSTKDTYTVRKKEVATLANAVLYDPKLSVSDRQVKLKQLSSIKVDTCHVSVIYSWQRSIIGSLESLIKDCESSRTAIERLVSKANDLERYSNDEKSITQQLQKLKPIKDTILVADIKSTLSTIKQSQLEITRASLATQEGKALRTLANDIMTQADTSWTALLSASDKQDRTAYEAEVVKLAGIYDRFSEISTLSANTYQTLLNELQAAFASANK